MTARCNVPFDRFLYSSAHYSPAQRPRRTSTFTTVRVTIRSAKQIRTTATTGAVRPFPDHFRHLLLLTLKKEAGYCVSLWLACVLTGHIRLLAAAILDDVVRDTVGQTYRLLVALGRLTIAVRTRQVCGLHI